MTALSADSCNGIMGGFIVRCAIVMVALSPLLRRFYIDRFWIHARGTVKRLEGRDQH